MKKWNKMAKLNSNLHLHLIKTNEFNFYRQIIIFIVNNIIKSIREYMNKFQEKENHRIKNRKFGISLIPFHKYTFDVPFTT